MPESAATIGWFPVLTLFAGYGLKLLSDSIQNRWTIAKDREAREAATREKRYERHTLFQRETLLALQDAAMDLARATGRTNFLDEMAYRESNTWRKSSLPEDLNEGFRLALVRTLTLGARVRDDSVRQLATQLRVYSDQTASLKNRDDASRALAGMANTHEALNERIGEILRKMDHDDH